MIERVVPRFAAALLVLALGFPWVVRDGIPGVVIPGWVVPGACVNVTNYEGWMSTDCSPMTIGAPMFVPGTDGTVVSGSGHHARFALVGGIACVVIGMRRRSRKWFLRGGLSAGVVCIYFAGLERFTAGYACALFASMLMIVAGLPNRSVRPSGVFRSTFPATKT